MNPTMKDLGIDRLSPSHQLDLMREIWRSLDESNRPTEISDELADELDRRNAEMDADPSIGIPLEEVRREMEKLL
jgi:putative addiction module component (TIGR02574 family)